MSFNEYLGSFLSLSPQPGNIRTKETNKTMYVVVLVFCNICSPPCQVAIKSRLYEILLKDKYLVENLFTWQKLITGISFSQTGTNGATITVYTKSN